MDGVIYAEETAGVHGGPESDTKVPLEDRSVGAPRAPQASTLWVWTDFCIPRLLWIPRLQEDFQD